MDIFGKDFLFLPIHQDSHWSLVVVCYPGQIESKAMGRESKILHLDSMGGMCMCKTDGALCFLS